MAISVSQARAELLTDKIKVDPRFLIESTFYILNKESRLVPFVFNDVQSHYWPRITTRDLVLKSRKEGFTTIRLARMVAKCATIPYRRAIVVSHEEESTKRILSRAVEMIKNCAINLCAKVTESTISFPQMKSSLYIGTAGAKAFGRGDDVTDYHLTEFAWWQKPDLITGIEEACVKDSEGCIESTAHGYGNPFHMLWVKSDKGEAGIILPDGAPRKYARHFYGWWQDNTLKVDCTRPLTDVNEYERNLKTEFGVTDSQLLWRRMKKESMFDPSLFEQEYPAFCEEAFLVSGAMVFDALALAKHEKTARPVLWRGEIIDKGDRVGMEPSDRGRLSVYRVPSRNGKYVISADVAAGISEGCFSVADVWDLANNEQVAQWRGHVAPELFGDVLCLLGAYYNYAQLVPEVNNHGLTTCTRIQDNQYPNLYRREKSTGGSDLGFYTSPGRQGTKIEIINSARAAVREFSFKINSLQTISEMRSFVKLENDEMDHMPGAFSDCVITAGIGAIMLAKSEYIPEETHESDRIIKGRVSSRMNIPKFRTGYQ